MIARSPRSPPLFALLLLLLASIWPSTVHGDGKLFPPVGFSKVETPAQRALVHWAEGVETLVVETTARSDATHLAWLIPLPAPPTSVRAVNPGLFPTLQTICRARVITKPSWAWVGGVIAGFLTLLIRWQVQRKLPVRVLDCVLLLLVMLVFVSMLLPSLGKAQAGGGSETDSSTIQLLAQERAGVFDVTTLTARRATDVLGWLENHGFATFDGLEAVIADYLKQGWVFAAAKVSKSRVDGLVSLHPVAFTFSTAHPVYPMKLTGVGVETLTCDLYVFGPGRAAAEGWSTAYCARPSYATNAPADLRRSGLRIRQPELAALTELAPVATKLSATLAGPRLRQDVLLSWEAYLAIGQKAYTPEAGLALAASVAVWLGVMGVLVGCGQRPQPGRPTWFNTIDRLTLRLAAVVAVLVLVGLPWTRATSTQTVQRWPVATGRSQLLYHALEASDLPEIQDALRAAAVDDAHLARARLALGEWMRTNALPLRPGEPFRAISNVFSGERLRMEISPGNLWLEPSTNGLDAVWHDFDGFPAHRSSVPRQ